MDPALSSPKKFVTELFKFAKSKDTDGEMILFESLDFELQQAITSAGAAVLSGQKATSLKQWLEFMIQAVRLIVEKDASLQHFQWQSPGQDTFGGKLLRRLYGLCGSSSLDAVKVTVPEKSPPKGLVLMTGKAGGNLDDLAPLASWWNSKGFTCIQAVKVGWDAYLRDRQVTKILAELVKHDVQRLGVIVHCFSENGFTLWGLIMKQWLKATEKGLPPLHEALRGGVYDSCSTYGFYNPDAGPPEPKDVDMKGYVRYVVMRSIMGLATRELDPASECMSLLSTDGPVATAYDRWYTERGYVDDPLFNSFQKNWFEYSQYEPVAIPRICFYSDIDTSVPAEGIKASAALRKEQGQETEMIHYEKTEHCKHHELDGGKIYFGRLGDWLSKQFPSSIAEKAEDHAPSESMTAVADKGETGIAEKGLKPSGSPAKPVWEVIGGADKGGILVREGEGLKSSACAERLAQGSLIEEITLIGQRLHYTLLSGTGPGEGWISLKVAGKDLVAPRPLDDASTGA